MSIEIKNGQRAVEYPAECYAALLMRSTEVPTYRTQSGKKMSEQLLRWEWGEAFYTTFSRIHSIDGHGQCQAEKKSPPNKQFIPHHLSRGQKSQQKNSRTFFFLAKSQNYIFSVWFVAFFLLRLLEIPEEMDV